MSIARRIGRVFERLRRRRDFGEQHHGTDVRTDIKKLLPRAKIQVIFDVGAHVGRRAAEFADAFPNAALYCFEPIGSSFKELERRFGGNTNVRCFRLALGTARGSASMTVPRSTELSRIVSPAQKSPDGDLQSVDIEALDDFCRDHGVERISYAKIDAEGHDLAVMTGSQRMLRDKRIDIIELEAGMNRRNTTHVPLEALKGFLEERGYFLFGLYEQMHEWPTGAPQLRRVNPVFISETLAADNTPC